MTDELCENYLRSDYVVNDNGRLIYVRIGAPNDDLELLHLRYDVKSSAFVTACNSGSIPASEWENEQANASLAADLERLSIPYLRGHARDPVGEGPLEHGFFCFGIDRALVISLGRKYRQNAVVWTGAGNVPELVITLE